MPRMRSDLKSLEVTRREFRKLTGISTDAIPMQAPRLSAYRQVAVSISLVFFGFLGVICFWSIAINPVLAAFVILLAVGISILLMQIANSFYRKALHHYNSMEPLRELIIEIQKHKDVIKAIDIRDQLEDAGNKAIASENRQRVVEALRLTRADLIRALKTEKILRINQAFIAQNPDMFAGNLAAVRALQLNDQAGDWAKLLNQTLQIAVEVQEEMYKLQDRN